MTRKEIVAVAAVVLVGIAVLLGLYLGGLIFSQKTANLRGETGKRNLVEGRGSFRIAAYDHFFDLCTSVQSFEAQRTAQQAELAGHPSAYRAEQVRSNLAAIDAQRTAAIRQYNNDARKTYTEGQFRSSDLPFQLDPSAKETSCTV
jgi:hypothetical protein